MFLVKIKYIRTDKAEKAGLTNIKFKLQQLL
jgi:hypothetical protein